MSKCTKPNCDCLERAEKANGGPLKDGYQCLYNTDAINAAKEEYRPSPSLPETEQGDAFQTGKDFIDDIPVPKEVQQWIDKQKLSNGDDDHIQVNMHLQEKCIALWRMMYRQVHAARQTTEIEIKHRDAIIADLRDTAPCDESLRKCVCPDFFGSHADCSFPKCDYKHKEPTKSPSPDQPVPEEVMEMCNKIALEVCPDECYGESEKDVNKNPYRLEFLEGAKNGAYAMYKRDRAALEKLQEELKQRDYERHCAAEMQKHLTEQLEEARNDANIFQEWWKKAKADLEAMTEERDAIRKAFDLQAEELRKLRQISEQLSSCYKSRMDNHDCLPVSLGMPCAFPYCNCKLKQS